MKNTLLSLVLILIINCLLAQKDSITYNDLQKEYETYINTELEAFKKYKENRDKEFSEFLKNDWENIELLKQGNPVKLPGPAKVPVLKEEITKIPITKISNKKLTKIKLPNNNVVQMNLRPIPKLQKPTAKKDYAFLEINFYGTRLSFIYPKKYKNLKLGSVNEEEISKFWTQAAESDHYRLIEKMIEYKNDLSLNDYAFLKLCEQISENILSTKNEQNLLTWFLLSKTGYQTKIGYEKQNIHLLIPVVNLLYSYSYFVFDNLKYFVLEKECKINTIYTYKQNYPDANKIMNFNMYVAPVFEEDVLTRNLKFSYNNKKYDLDIKYNQNLIDFYSDYPQGEIQIFFNAGISHTAKESLDRYFDSILIDMDEVDAANFLLHFTQTAFSYKTDGEQFGYEKFFFPEEIFHFKYADCEDRSVFFSYLVNEYLNLSVVGLNYPGHIATAVNFSKKTDGMYFQIGENRYVICDPTYINAPVGLCMPEYVNADVKVLQLNNSHINNTNEDKVWNSLLNKGYVRTNYENDMVKTKSNEYYMTGVLQDSVLINGELIRYNDFSEILFICKTDHEGSLIDYNLINGGGLLLPAGIFQLDNRIYLSGYFNNLITCQDDTLNANSDKDMFIASFDNELNLLWIKTTSLFVGNPNVNQYFNFVINISGEIIAKSNINEQSFYSQKPIFNNGKDIVFKGFYPAINSIVAESQIYDKQNTYEFAKLLNKITQSFISKHYDSKSASLFAFLTILESGKIKLKSKEILATILTINPDFEKDYPKLYKNIRDIVNIRNKNNIITIKVKTLDDFRIKGLIIENNARISVKSYQNGNIQISVLSGMFYKPFIRKHKINYIKLYKNTGNLIINYDTDNDQKKLNLEKDLLK